MAWLKRNAKTALIVLVVLLLTEGIVARYLIRQYRESNARREAALMTAVADAGYVRADAEHVEMELQTRSGEAWYVIEFTVSGTDDAYEYLVDAGDGSILYARKK